MVETGSAGLGVLTRRRRRRPPRCPGRRRDGEEGLEAGTSVRGAAVAADELLTLLCVLMFLIYCFFISGERTSGHWRDRLFGAAASDVEVRRRRRRRRRRPERFFFFFVDANPGRAAAASMPSMAEAADDSTLTAADSEASAAVSAELAVQTGASCSVQTTRNLGQVSTGVATRALLVQRDGLQQLPWEMTVQSPVLGNSPRVTGGGHDYRRRGRESRAARDRAILSCRDAWSLCRRPRA